MKFSTAVFLCFVSAAAAAQTPEPALAYQADVVVTYQGKTSSSRVFSDGVRRKTESTVDGQAAGTYSDSTKKLSWNWGPGYGCLQMPIRPAGATSKEEAAGGETIDGHPTRKLKMTSTLTRDGKTTTFVEYVWRATDLQDLVIQRKSDDGSSVVNVKNIVLGKPDEKFLAFPSPQCKYDERLDDRDYAPLAPGGSRTVRFSDASVQETRAAAPDARDPVRLRDPQGGALAASGGRQTTSGACLRRASKLISRDQGRSTGAAFRTRPSTTRFESASSTGRGPTTSGRRELRATGA